MPNIFITGASGSIGDKLKSALEADGDSVILPKDSSLRIENSDYFESIDLPENIDILYHLAAISNVPQSWTAPADFIKVNVLGTSRVLEFCRTHQIKLVYISSYAYGIPNYLPIDEKHPVSAANPYAMSKIMAEELCSFYGLNFGLNYTIVRPFNVYGSLENKALLIPEIIHQIQNNDSIKVQDLEPLRDYVYITDFVRFLVKAKNQITNEIYNVGSGKAHSVADLIQICQTVWGTSLPVISNQNIRKNEIPKTICDASKAKQILDWAPQYTLEEGILDMKNQLENK